MAFPGKLSHGESVVVSWKGICGSIKQIVINPVWVIAGARPEEEVSGADTTSAASAFSNAATAAAFSATPEIAIESMTPWGGGFAATGLGGLD